MKGALPVPLEQHLLTHAQLGGDHVHRHQVVDVEAVGSQGNQLGRGVPVEATDTQG